MTYKPKDIFDAKVHLLQSLAMPASIAKNSDFFHPCNGTWLEECPSSSAWHFRSLDSRFSATVHWSSRIVTFYRRR